MGRMKAAYDRKLYGTPATGGAAHPLDPALRQVGGGFEGDAKQGQTRTCHPVDLEANPGASKKSRKA